MERLIKAETLTSRQAPKFVSGRENHDDDGDDEDDGNDGDGDDADNNGDDDDVGDDGNM